MNDLMQNLQNNLILTKQILQYESQLMQQQQIKKQEQTKQLGLSIQNQDQKQVDNIITNNLTRISKTNFQVIAALKAQQAKNVLQQNNQIHSSDIYITKNINKQYIKPKILKIIYIQTLRRIFNLYRQQNKQITDKKFHFRKGFAIFNKVIYNYLYKYLKATLEYQILMNKLKKKFRQKKLYSLFKKQQAQYKLEKLQKLQNQALQKIKKMSEQKFRNQIYHYRQIFFQSLVYHNNSVKIMEKKSKSAMKVRKFYIHYMKRIFMAIRSMKQPLIIQKQILQFFTQFTKFRTKKINQFLKYSLIQIRQRYFFNLKIQKIRQMILIIQDNQKSKMKYNQLVFFKSQYNILQIEGGVKKLIKSQFTRNYIFKCFSMSKIMNMNEQKREMFNKLRRLDKTLNLTYLKIKKFSFKSINDYIKLLLNKIQSILKISRINETRYKKYYYQQYRSQTGRLNNVESLIQNFISITRKNLILPNYQVFLNLISKISNKKKSVQQIEFFFNKGFNKQRYTLFYIYKQYQLKIDQNLNDFIQIKQFLQQVLQKLNILWNKINNQGSQSLQIKINQIRYQFPYNLKLIKLLQKEIKQMYQKSMNLSRLNLKKSIQFKKVINYLKLN